MERVEGGGIPLTQEKKVPQGAEGNKCAGGRKRY